MLAPSFPKPMTASFLLMRRRFADHPPHVKSNTPVTSNSRVDHAAASGIIRRHDQGFIQ
jgi:hypothetical protein